VGEIVDIDAAAEIVDRGGLVCAPTETVYGLVGRPTDEIVRRIFDVKHRPSEKRTQLLIPDAAWLDRLERLSPAASALAAAFWPGPLTLVVRAPDGAPSPVATDGTIGVRVPAHRVGVELVALGGPRAASRANTSGQPTPATIEEIRQIFGAAVDGYLDGGPIVGSGSTVVDLTGAEPVVLRAGPLSPSDVEAVLHGSI
jgi:L-threonylcarbamoyladenylate synthase